MTPKLKKYFIEKLSKYPAFYQKVWKECLKIPKGSVLTYKELARRIGHPKAARAVGTALSKNPFAPLVPCHRVIRTDGGMGGYSGPGGVRQKKKMLFNENPK